MRFIWIIVVFVCGCTPINHEAIELCKTAIVGLNPNVKIQIHAVKSTHTEVKIDFNGSWIACHFKAIEGANYPEINAIETPNGLVSDIKFLFLKRFYLDSGMAIEESRAFIMQEKRIDGSFTTAYFLQTLMNSLPQASLYMVLALAFALLYGLSGRVLFGFGEVSVFASYIAIFMLFYAPIAAICLMLLLQRGYITRLFYNNTGFSLMIASLASAVVLSETMRLIFGAGQMWVKPILSAPVNFFHSENFITTFTVNQLITISFSIMLTLVILKLFHSSKFALQWKAVSQDMEIAALFGISREAVLKKTLLISGGLAGFAGALLTFHYGVAHYSYALLFGLKALVAAIIGGVGSLTGAVVAAFAIGLIEGFWGGYTPLIWREAVVFVLAVGVICLREKST